MNAPGWLSADERAALCALLALLAARGAPEPLLVGAVALRTRLPPDRRLEASREPDLAVMLDSMSELDAVLNAAEAFDVRRDGFRMIHRATSVGIDLVPFGGLEDPAGQARFPGRTIVVAGFREAWERADVVAIDAHHAVRVPTATFLLALKLFAFDDRREPKDLSDAERLLRALPEPADPWADDAMLDHMAARDIDAGDLRIWSATRELQRHLEAPARGRLQRIVQALHDADFPTRGPMRLLVGRGDDVDDQDRTVRHQLAVMALAMAAPDDG